MAVKARWAFPLIAAVAIVIFLAFAASSASAATIRGTVTDTNDVRVNGASVTLYHDGQIYVHQNNPAKTDVTGYYEFTGLPDGAYSVQADKDGYLSLSDSRVLAGSDADVNLKIPGYDSKAITPTVKVYVTPSPTPAPPAPKPTVTPVPTMVPLPTPETAPGYGLLLVLAALGLIAAAWKR